MSKRIEYGFVKKRFEDRDWCLISGEYINNQTKLECVCPEGHKHSISWSHFQSGGGCPYCNIDDQRLGYEYVREQFVKEGYKLLSKEYVNNKTKLKYRCPEGHDHSISLVEWQRGRRCPYCCGYLRPTIDFIRSEFAKCGYTLLTKEYINSRQKLEYICPNGHKHVIDWGHWNLRGHRCPTCKAINIRGKNHWNWQGGKVLFSRCVRNFIKNNDTWFQDVLVRDDYICQYCKAGGYLEAHHLIPIFEIIDYYNLSTIDEVRQCGLLFDISNGITLCLACHTWVHSKRNTNREYLHGF